MKSYKSNAGALPIRILVIYLQKNVFADDFFRICHLIFAIVKLSFNFILFLS